MVLSGSSNARVHASAAHERLRKWILHPRAECAVFLLNEPGKERESVNVRELTRKGTKVSGLLEQR